ncbi:Transposase, mutator type [Pararhodospirillum photometricum DSM 122]|uniref:Transposase, mutator type n=1 Tax=Pararhodospirillum photometricum DSM 122 TaxID=1150469 RepID=H6SM00_PARPM|nr:Transposase, mutator type [Pararhodospirillum photometricum DSM 122]
MRLRPRPDGCGSKGSSAPHSSSVRSLGYRFVFFSMAAIRLHVDLFHIDSRSVDDLVKAMGMSGISKSQVSRLCAESTAKL